MTNKVKYICSNCGKHFIHDKQNILAPRCPKCGSDKVSENQEVK